MTKTDSSLIKPVVLGVFILISQLFSACGQTNNNENKTTKRKKIDDIISLYADYERFNGSVLVAHEGEVIYKKGFGFATMEWDIPNQIDTKFQIASMTKSFTALLVLQLVAEGKLELNTPITTYLPDYPKTNGDQITIHHLLTHSSGLANDPSDDKTYNQPRDMVNQFASAPLKFKPGERFEYSNSGYTLLGYIIATVTQKSYEDVLKEKIFTPLNMKNSGFYRHRPVIKNMASGHYKNFGEYYNSDDTDETSSYAAGAIYSTIEDLFLWDQALKTEILLPEKYMNLMFEKHIVVPSYDGHYGYGWEFINKPIGNTENTVGTIGHSGSIGGFRSLYTKIPDSKTAIIFLNNTNHASLTSMTTAITGILHDESYDFPRKPAAKFMTDVIVKEGIEKGIQFYTKHKDVSDYYIDETELIVVGYKLLHGGNVKDAAKVFKLSTEVFPDRANPYDSYAEALMALGKNKEAIENYKQSLKLNPNNENAIKMLKTIGIHYTSDVLETDDTWQKELFTFPLHFARDIDFTGIEDARFPHGWRDVESPNFWSYAFAWNINLNTELTSKKLEDYVQKYYDGLLNGVNKNKDFVLPKTNASFQKNKEDVFFGNATIFDTFATNQALELNFTVSQKLCNDKNKSIVVFRISPKAFGTQIWQQLNLIKLREGVCED